MKSPSRILSFSLTTFLSCCPLSAQQAGIHPSLQNAVSKIDLAGTYVILNRVDGDIKLLASYVEQCLELARANGSNIPESLKTKDVLRITALDQILSYALSNTEMEQIWLNKAYLENGGCREGVFSLLGGDASDFSVTRMAPIGTDLAFQLSLDLRKIPDIAQAIGTSFNTTEETEIVLKEQIGSIKINLGDALKRSNIRINVAIDFNEDKRVDFGKIKIGEPNVVIRIDGLIWLWKEAGEKAIKDIALPLDRKEENGIITYSAPPAMKEAFHGFAPTIVVDIPNDQIWFASTPAFLENARTPGQQLIDDPKFLATWKNLPEKGNSMLYISKSCLTELSSIYEQAEQNGLMNDPKLKNAKPLIEKLMADISKSDSGLAAVLTQDADGVSLVNKMPFPGKYTFLLQALGALGQKSVRHEDVQALPAPVDE